MRLERNSGRPHPALEGYEPVSPHFQWLQQAFFRIHRRRSQTEVGFQPLGMQEIVTFGRDVLRVDANELPFFCSVVEACDDAVISDYRSEQASKTKKRKSK